MRTKILIQFFTLILSATAFAQQPRIDSIAVDEDKGELVLHGNFQNSASAIVLVDSVSLTVTVASDTLLRATIPDSGKGSCGHVTVAINGKISDIKLLTYFHIEVTSSYLHLYSDATKEAEFVDNLIHLRTNILDFAGIGTHSIIPTKLSKYHIIASGGNGIHGGHYYGAHYDSTVSLSRSILYDARNKDFQFYYWMPNNYDTTQIYESANIRVNENFGIIHDHSQDFPGTGSSCGGGLQGHCSDINAIAPTQFPPSSTSVHEAPSNPNILQAHLSSDPIAANAEMIITLYDAMKVQMQIMDILGHIVFSEERKLSAGENKLPINSSRLPSGIYICRLQAGGCVGAVCEGIII